MVELNKSGLFLEADDFDYERVQSIVVNHNNDIIWGKPRHALSHFRQVRSISHQGTVYDITHFEDVKSGILFGGKCTCPAFQFGTTRPCKHMEDEGLGDTVDIERRVDKRRPKGFGGYPHRTTLSDSCKW